MTITVTTIDQGPFIATGVEQAINYTFMTLTDGEIAVYTSKGASRVLLDPSVYVVERNRAFDGSAEEGGTVTLNAGSAEVGSSIYLRAAPRDDRDIVWSDTGSRLKNLNEEQDRITLRALVANEVLSRALVVSAGQTPPDPGDLVDSFNKANKDLSNAEIPPVTEFGAPAAPALILERDATPERFGVTPNMKAGLADFSGVLQAMLDSTQQTAADAKKAIIIPGGDYVMEEQASITCGNYDGGAVSLLGEGGKTARLIAHPDNADGLLKIIRAHNMETVHVEGLTFCSRLLQRTSNAVLNAKNPLYATAPINKNNGTALLIDGPIPGDGIYGVEDMTAVRVMNNLWCGIGDDQDLTAWNGIWNKALHVKGAWFGEFIGNHFAGLFEADCAAGFVNGNNVAAMHLEHCYAPDVIRNKFNGVWDINAWLEGKEAGAGADISARFGVRWEGGRLSKNIFGGLARDAVVISHEYGPGTLQSPGFQIDHNHVNFRRNGITINGHRQIESTSNEFYAREVANPFGEALPAAYKLTDCGDFDSTNDAFLEIGWRTDDANAFVCYRVIDKLQGFKAHGPRFNCNGIGLHISAPTGASSPDPTVYTRSFQVLDAVEGGRRAFDLWGTAGFKKYVDLSGVRGIAWETIEQVNGSDLKRIISNASEPTNTISSGIVHDTDNSDFASRSDPLAGFIGVRARNSTGVFAPCWYVQARFQSNVSGGENAIVDLLVKKGGADTVFMSFDGPSGWVLTGAGRALKVGAGLSAWGVNPPGARPTVTGSRGGNAALASLLTAIAATGIIVDGTTA